MQIRTLNIDKMKKKYNMGEVTNHKLTGPGSLFDPDIFGESTDTGMPKFGYVRLKGWYIDPSFYSILSRLYRDLKFIIDGTAKYVIEDGVLVKSNEGFTGIRWFYENFENIKFEKLKRSLEEGNNRTQSLLMKKAFLKLKKSDIFIDKLIILPRRYRDIDTSKGTSIKMDELNQYYIDLVRTVNGKSNFEDNVFFNKQILDSKVQKCIMNIYNYIADRFYGKNGVQSNNGLSRTIDNASRVVIVAPTITDMDEIGNTRRKLNQCTIPLHHIMNSSPVHCVTATKMILNQMKSYGLIEADEDEFDYFYTEDYIKEKAEEYHQSPTSRLDPVKKPNGENIELYFKIFNKTRKRYLTWFELFALAVNLYIGKVRNAFVRHPVTSKASKVYTKPQPSYAIRPAGTLYLYANEEAVENDDYFDKIDGFNDAGEMIDNYPKKFYPSLFDESIVFSNLYLAGLNGDYDGDKVINELLYSEEAVKEIDDFLTSPMAHLSPGGENIRPITNEATQGLWNLTTDKHQAKLKLPKVTEDLTKVFDKGTEGFYKMEVVTDLLIKYHPESPITYKGINTTVGRVIFNEIVFNHLGENHKFINETMTGGKINYTINTYAAKLLDDHQPWFGMDEYLKMMDKIHDLGFGVVDLIGSTLDYDTLIADDKVFNEKKAELFKNIDTILENNDGPAMQKIENEMVEFMKEHYSGNQMSDMYDSGSKTKWNDDLKLMKVSQGLAPIPGTTEYTIIASNLKDGISERDIAPNANLQIYGAYNRAVEVQNSGYTTKLLYRAFQNTLLYEGDCGSDKFLEINTTNRADLLFRYAKGKDGLVLIDSSNIEKFLGKDILIRTPVFCKHKKGICSKCAGELLPKLYKKESGVPEKMNVGLFIADIGSAISNKFMKKTHDMNRKIYEITDLNEFLI